MTPMDTATMATHAAAVWFQLEPHITPFTNVLNIPGETFRSLDHTGKLMIAHAFMQYTTEEAMFCRDGTGNDRYFLGNPKHFVDGNGVIIDVMGGEPFWFPFFNNNDITKLVVSKSKEYNFDKSKDKKVPRPPNAYILYRKERHSLVKQANPGITNNEISQVLGAAWNAETREVRQKYKEKAEAVKEALLKAHPDYQYRPRRPSERRRRVRRNTQSQQASSQGEGSSQDQTDAIDASPSDNTMEGDMALENAGTIQI